MPWLFPFLNSPSNLPQLPSVCSPKYFIAFVKLTVTVRQIIEKGSYVFVFRIVHLNRNALSTSSPLLINFTWVHVLLFVDKNLLLFCIKLFSAPLSLTFKKSIIFSKLFYPHQQVTIYISAVRSNVFAELKSLTIHCHNLLYSKKHHIRYHNLRIMSEFHNHTFRHLSTLNLQLWGLLTCRF